MKQGKLPAHKEIERLYREEYRPLYEEFAARLHALLELLVKDTGIPVDHIEHRVKTIESFMEKIERKSYPDPFRQIKDYIGLRIVTFYQDSVKNEKLIPELETKAEQLQSFVELVTAQDEILYAVPVDVLVLLVSFARTNTLPPEFDWGGMYEPFFVEALRKICRTIS